MDCNEAIVYIGPLVYKVFIKQFATNFNYDDLEEEATIVGTVIEKREYDDSIDERQGLLAF